MLPDKKQPARKLATIGLATALLIGFSAALSIESPGTDDVVSGDVNVSLTDSDSDSADSYYVYFQTSGGSSWTPASNSPFSDEGAFTDFFWDASSLNGDYTLNVTNSSSTPWTSDTVSITVDNNPPSASLSSPSEFTNDESPNVKVSGSDSTSSVVNVTFMVLDSTGDIVDTGQTCTGSSECSADVSDLSEETHKVNYTVYDEAANRDSDNLSFTVDTTKDFTVDPDFDETGVVLWDDDYDLDFDIEENDESEDLTVECIDEGEAETIDTDSGSGTAFACDIDDEYSDSTVDISVEVCDVADNCETSDAEEFTFDATAPTIIESSIPGKLVNGEYPVEFTASDESGIDEAEYFYDDSDVKPGSGNSVDINSSDEEFMASVDGLDKGEHTVYFRVKDNAERWSSTDSLDIDYRPNANPEITVQAPNSLTVTAGEETGFQVTVENTGDIFIGGSSLTAEVSGIFSEDQLIEDLEPSDSTTMTYSINTTEDDLGKYDLELGSSNPDSSETIELVVEATEEQKDELDSRLSDYESKLQDLQQKVDNRKKDLPEDLQSRLEANFSTFKQKVEKARTAKENSNYYRVSSTLEGIDTEHQSAQTSYEEVDRIDNNRDRRRLMIIGAAVLLLLLVAGGAFYYFESDGELDLDIGGLVSGEGEGGISEKVSSLLASKEEEAEEFEWDGFND